MSSEKRKEQQNKAAARWRKKNPGASTEYAQKTKYAAQKRWAAKNKEKLRLYSRRAYWKNVEALRARRREQCKQAWLTDPEGTRALKRKYHRNMMERRVGRPRPKNCELCSKPFKGMPHADHDHASGKYRGWVCTRCNTVLGQVGDSIELLHLLGLWIKHSGPKELV